MSLNKTYAVFGLGRYGFSVAKELINWFTGFQNWFTEPKTANS